MVRVASYKNPRDITTRDLQTSVDASVEFNTLRCKSQANIGHQIMKVWEEDTYNCDNVPNSWLKHSTVFTIRRTCGFCINIKPAGLADKNGVQI